jgi:hypothetical protein
MHLAGLWPGVLLLAGMLRLATWLFAGAWLVGMLRLVAAL